jgi:hypothetical protein
MSGLRERWPTPTPPPLHLHRRQLQSVPLAAPIVCARRPCSSCLHNTCDENAWRPHGRRRGRAGGRTERAGRAPHQGSRHLRSRGVAASVFVTPRQMVDTHRRAAHRPHAAIAAIAQPQGGEREALMQGGSNRSNSDGGRRRRSSVTERATGVVMPVQGWRWQRWRCARAAAAASSTG